jgi:hypothetical protein
MMIWRICGMSSFLLQNSYNEIHADNFMMHLLVTDVDAWWHHVQAQGIASKYDTKTEPPEDRPWCIRDFVLVDPTGVLWRIGENISTVRSVRALSQLSQLGRLISDFCGAPAPKRESNQRPPLANRL